MNNELMHYGVLGMRWGRKRAQKESGSKTSKGKSDKKKISESEVSEKKSKGKAVAGKILKGVGKTALVAGTIVGAAVAAKYTVAKVIYDFGSAILDI